MPCVVSIPATANSSPILRSWGRWGAMCVVSAGLLLMASGCTMLQKDPAQPREVKAGTVSVTTDNPASFTPVASERRDTKAERRAWVEKISEHFADRVAEALPDGERAEINISDIRRASVMSMSDSAAGEARTRQEVVPPRIVLTFRRFSSKGKVVQAASRTLQDQALQLKGRRYADDPLRYEKALVDDWVEKEFKSLRSN